MSLINEALKRARDESVRREASSKGVPLAPVLPTRDRNRWFPITVLALTVALAASLVAVVNLSSKLPDTASPSPTMDSARPEAVAKVEIEPTLSRPADTSDFAPAPTRSVASEHDTDSSSPTASAAATVAAPEAETASEPEIIVPEVVSAPIEQATPPQKEVADTEARIFVRHVELVGGQSIDLGGIAWSEAGPYALLNGRVVGIGESVGGYRVSDIDPHQVSLERDDDLVVLRLK